MIDHVVVDVEIQKTIDQCSKGWQSTDEMGVGVAVVYEFKADRFRIFGPDDRTELVERLLKAEKVSGFNIWKFDFPVIWGVPSHVKIEEMRSKTNDMLINIWRNLGLRLDIFTGAHKGWNLNNVMSATLGVEKIANGAEAPIWFQEGKIHKLINYCIDDVSLERDLVIHMEKEKYVMHPTKGRLDLILPEWNP